MNIAILGFDLEGQANYEYYRSAGHQITVCDHDPATVVPQDCGSQLGPDYLYNLDRFDLILRTPGLKPADILAANPTVSSKITSGTNEFFRVCPTKRVIGVTGSKGKGTTSTLIAQMLQGSGLTVHLGGNIGVPALRLLPAIKPDDWVVLELSSFQLIDLHYSPTLALCLMIVPEHLNWHSDMAEYLEAKQQLFLHQTTQDRAVFYNQNPSSIEIASAGEGQMISYGEDPGAVVTGQTIKIDDQIICQLDELKLIGAHNWQNVCAAVTVVWQITHDVAAIRSVLTTFSGLEHRLEFVRSVHGVKYYDDSFGTNPETAIVAMQAFEGAKVLILGGSDKGAQYDLLAKAVVDNHVKAVVLIGDTAPAIKTALQAAGYSHIVDGAATMPEILAQAKAKAHFGTTVLLSTGCASFGLFHDYKDRGNQFKQAVVAL